MEWSALAGASGSSDLSDVSVMCDDKVRVSRQAAVGGGQPRGAGAGRRGDGE